MIENEKFDFLIEIENAYSGTSGGGNGTRVVQGLW